MRVVILGAGVGQRLGSSMPKPLARLATGQTILDMQLERIAQVSSLEKVILVVGYKKEVLMDRYPGLMYVYNPDFAYENTAKSLLRAVRKLDEDLLWMNGDVVFDREILPRLLQTTGNGIVVNEAVVGAEEVKYRSDQSGCIREISKNVENGEGEALGINLLRRSGIRRFQHTLERCESQDYFERGLQWCVRDGMELQAVRVAQESCVEVDFPEDLERADAMVRRWGAPKTAPLPKRSEWE